MAGDWIKIEHAMPDKPEVSVIASSLAIDHDAAVGKLLRLWIWADQQSVDGNAVGVTPAFIDRLANCPGFFDALVKVGWLKDRNGRLSIPNFDRHNGQTAKSRALTSNRVKRSRNGAGVTDALPEKRREEKRRIQEPIPTQGSCSQVLPTWISSQPAQDAFAEWFAHLARHGKPPIDPALVVAKAAGFFASADELVRSIDYAIMQNYVTLKNYAAADLMPKGTGIEQPEDNRPLTDEDFD